MTDWPGPPVASIQPNPQWRETPPAAARRAAVAAHPCQRFAVLALDEISLTLLGEDPTWAQAGATNGANLIAQSGPQPSDLRLSTTASFLQPRHAFG